MVKVKLIVSAFYYKIIYVICLNYCNICEDHTLCKYVVPGYNNSCKGYDDSVFITETDKINIVNRINEKRNLIATGVVKTLPQAANMRKMYWSDELAESAQRWAHQCHPKPNTEDACRNLEHMDVGQCISYISGPTSNLNVKSFIDSWFMSSMTYFGSVSFYNESLDYTNRYFTQLIWADTYRVGCGRSKYHINNGITAIDKLVCNFAPSGNIHGRTVYAIGFPATQCPLNTTPDATFKALCSFIHNKLKNYWSPMNQTFAANTINTRNQKLRHISSVGNSDSRSYRTSKPHLIRKPSLHEEPRVYNQQNKEDFTQNLHKCTRYLSPTLNSIKSTSNMPNVCTRGLKRLEYILTTTTNPPEMYDNKCTRRNRASETKCPCVTPLQCRCLFDSFKVAMLPKNKISSANIFNPNIFYNNPHVNTRSALNNPYYVNLFRPKTDKIDYENLPPFKVIFTNTHPPDNVMPNNYNSRTKRQYEEKRGDMFMQYELPLKRPQGLKSLRYTTLPRIKSRLITTGSKKGSRKGSSTEIITITNADLSIYKTDYKHNIPEKFLSFEELIKIHKNNKDNINSGRRKNEQEGEGQGEEEEEKEETQSETEATLFSKIKHCTRKLTCTWTAPSRNGSRPNRGSRTPPGYVEGCTRTSTCTREFLERNKFPTSETETSDAPDEDYCEKRSLKVIRSNLMKKIISKSNDCNTRIFLSTKPMMRTTTKSYTYNNYKEYKDISSDLSENPLSCIC